MVVFFICKICYGVISLVFAIVNIISLVLLNIYGVCCDFNIEFHAFSVSLHTKKYIYTIYFIIFV